MIRNAASASEPTRNFRNIGTRTRTDSGCNTGCGSISGWVLDKSSEPLGPIWRFVAARALNTFGRAVINTTVLWELYERTSAKLVLAAVGVMQVIPVIVLFFPAGWITDHFDRRRTAMFAALGMGTVGLGLSLASGLHAP